MGWTMGGADSKLRREGPRERGELVGVVWAEWLMGVLMRPLRVRDPLVGVASPE